MTDRHPAERIETPSASQPEPADDHWPQSVGQSPECANCGTPIADKYCLKCGQKHLNGRLKFSGVIKDILAKFADYEAGLLHTFLDLLKRPGHVARDYASGKQKPYMNPLGYFFLGTALQMASLFFCRSILVEKLTSDFDQAMSPAALENLRASFGDDPANGIAECYITSLQQGYAYAGLLFFCLPMALLLKWLQNLIAPSKFNLAETCVFSLYTFGQMLIITALFTPIVVRISFGLHGIMALATYFVYPQLAHAGFFPRSWSSRLVTAFVTAVSSAMFFCSIAAIFAAGLAVTIAMNR